MKVLLIEDDRDIANLFQYIGEAEHVETHVCESGTDALVYLESHPVDAVILDLKLPVLDGLTVAEEIRRNEENRPEVKRAVLAFYTGANIDPVVEKIAERADVAKIYQKPYDIGEIVSEIKGWLGH